jgi:predicted nucleotide-binding protein
MPPPKVQNKKRQPPTSSSCNENQERETKIFLVHGHANALREGVARFLEKLGFPVIILNEQPGKGRTIIEKFTDCTAVAFAVILLTGDDRGGKLMAPESELRPRSRQNVILELGFFLGRLGRDKVCPLYEYGVELPSDYNGTEFVLVDDSGAWKLSLARELKAAGLPVDMNRVVL